MARIAIPVTKQQQQKAARLLTERVYVPKIKKEVKSVGVFLGPYKFRKRCLPKVCRLL